MANCFCSVMSMLKKLGLLKMLRPWLPYVPGAGMPKGAVVGFNCGKAELGIHPGPTFPGTPGVKPKLGIGPVMAAREERRLSAVRMPLEMLNGSPVIQLAMLDQFQPPM